MTDNSTYYATMWNRFIFQAVHANQSTTIQYFNVVKSAIFFSSSTKYLIIAERIQNKRITNTNIDKQIVRLYYTKCKDKYDIKMNF